MTGAATSLKSDRSPSLLLVNPSTQKLGWVKNFQLPPLSLLHVAAVTPEEWRVDLVDETLESISDDVQYDLVGITAMTHQAVRAYELADAFRAKGVPVVLGGIHPTVLPDEAALHADAVLVGEAEGVWEGILADFLTGRMKPRYTSAEARGNVLTVPPARRDLIAGKRYLTHQSLQATRGCPYNCPFCTVTPYFGKLFRHRPIDEVIGEIAAFQKDFVLFLDDNILADVKWSKPFLEKLAPLGKRWAGQATLSFAQDPDLLALVERSGCIGLFVGVEDVSGDASRLPKLRSRTPVAELVKRVQDAGILIEASLIFGMDDQDESVFDEALAFVEECYPSTATFHILTPYPGTVLYRQFEEEGRLLHREWNRYNHDEVVFKPKLMSPERLYRGWVEARKSVYSWGSIISRTRRMKSRRLTSFAYNVFRRAPNRKLDPGGFKG